MSEAPAAVPRPRRSLTKTQLATPAGAELLALCQAITADGRIGEDEVHELRGWLDRSRGSGLPSEAFLTSTVERILADGRITDDELRELHKALEEVLPPDLRRSAQESRRAATAEARRKAKEDTAARKVAADLERQHNRSLEDFDFMVAGVMYEGRAKTLIDHLSGDDPDATAYLARDPSNRYSRNAVEVRLADGRVIGYVPERDEIAHDVAWYLDRGHKHVAYIKKVLTGGHTPIPVIVAHMLRPDATVEGAVTAAEVPGKSVVLGAITPAITAAPPTRPATRAPGPRPAARPSRRPPAGRRATRYLVGAILLAALWGVVALLLVHR